MTTKKKKIRDDLEQSEKFVQKGMNMIDAGELNPDEAEERFERALLKITPPAKRKSDT